MKLGVVTSDREIVVPIEILDGAGRALTADAVIDTGFTGFLTLPLALLETVGAIPAGTRRVELGNGQLTELDLYLANILWNGLAHEILILQAETTALIGMSLLWGSRIRFDCREGGEVVIDEVS